MADGKHPAEPTGAQTLPPDPPTHFRCRESRREVPRLRRSHGSAFRSPCLERRGRMKTGGPEGRAPEPPSQRRKTVGLGEVASCQAELRSQPGGGEAGVAKSGKQREGLSSLWEGKLRPTGWARRPRTDWEDSGFRWVGEEGGGGRGGPEAMTVGQAPLPAQAQQVLLAYW